MAPGLRLRKPASPSPKRLKWTHDVPQGQLRFPVGWPSRCHPSPTANHSNATNLTLQQERITEDHWTFAVEDRRPVLAHDS